METNFHHPQDPSEELIEEICNTKVNLIKEIWEIFGYNLQDTDAKVVFKNYLVENPINFNDGSLFDFGDFGSFENASLNGLTVDNLMTVFKGAKREYLGAALLVLEKYGDKVGLTNKGKLFVLAQMGHESGNFIYTAELGKGKGRQYGLPSGPYHKVYYGRGPIQITWENNYKIISEKYFPQMGININIWENPDLCELNLAIGCAASLAWFMIPGNGTRAVKYANEGNVNMLSKMINGGMKGLSDRINKTRKLLELAS